MKKLSLFILLLHITPITRAMSNATEVSQQESTDNLLKELRSLRGDHNRENRKRIMPQLIKKDPSNVDAIIYDDRTPLYESILFRDTPFARYLLQHNADVNKKIDTHAPLYHNVRMLNLSMKFDDPISFSKEIEQQKKIIKLLMFYNANPDLPIGKSPRSIANAEIQALIKQAEREKKVREYILVVAHITKDPGFIVASYLHNKFKQATAQELAQIEETNPFDFLNTP